MNVLLNISIYMIASSLIMVGYVWFKYIKHTHAISEQMLQTNNYTKEEEILSAGETLAA
ncbi:MAG: hypothetical protein ABIN97_17175 [Ginsengibacter sp.]